MAVEGWASESELDAIDLPNNLPTQAAAQCAQFDIERDGMMQGVNVDATVALAQASGLPVIASGGISELEDKAIAHAPRAAVSVAPSPAGRFTRAHSI